MMRLLVRDNGKVHLVVINPNAKLWINIFRGYLNGASPAIEQGYCGRKAEHGSAFDISGCRCQSHASESRVALHFTGWSFHSEYVVSAKQNNTTELCILLYFVSFMLSL